MNGISLCAGVCGLDLAVTIAVPGYRTVCAVERELGAVGILVARQQDGSLPPFPVWADIATFDGRPWRGIMDIVIAGIPCQPFSVAGKQQGLEDERWIWDDAFRIICEVGPQHIFLENVPGFIRGGLPAVLDDLAKIGFDTEWDHLRASDVGAPHKRERVFIYAWKRDMANSDR